MNLKVNLNADAIWQQLDLKDGTKDAKINNSVWNEFADIAGGNHINKFIEEKDALRSINAYLKNATQEVTNKICEFLGWNNSGANINDEITKSDNLLEQLANDPSFVSETKEGTFEDGTNWKAAYLNDGRYVQVRYSEDGSIESVHVSTDPTKAQTYRGNYGDAAEIAFNKNEISIGFSNDTDTYGADISQEGYDFAKYQKLAEDIFGAQSVETEENSEVQETSNINTSKEEYDDFYYNAHVIALGDNGFAVWRNYETGEIRYHNENKEEISAEEFKEFCPNIYNQIEARKTEKIVVKGDNGWYVTQDKNGNYYYYDKSNFERNEENFKEACPTIYENIQAKKK